METTTNREGTMKVYAYENRQIQCYTAKKIRELIAEEKATKA